MSERVEIFFEKSLQENADNYYALSKKAKKKLVGLEFGVREVKKKIASGNASKKDAKVLVAKREKKWFEKFHWFFTSEGFLVIGGRDAKSNETIVKKLMKNDDVYFHADIHGAPHTILVTGGKKVSKKSLEEAAIFAASFSKAWAEKISAVDVYSAKPGQVSKSAPTGESIGTGAFMIYGKRDWFKKTPLGLAIGFNEKVSPVLFSGSPDAVKSRADFFVPLSLGSDSKGDCAKKIMVFFKSRGISVSLDDIVSLLPNGGIKAEISASK